MVCVPLGRMVENHLKVISENLQELMNLALWEKAPKWHEAKLRVSSPEKFTDIIEWVESNIQGWKKHTVWRLTDGGILEIRFRYERDYNWFVLRWL